MKLEQLERLLTVNVGAPACVVGKRLGFADLIGFSLVDDTQWPFPGSMRDLPGFLAWHESVAQRGPVRYSIRRQAPMA